MSEAMTRRDGWGALPSIVRVAALLALALVACEPPDRPPVVPRGLSDEVVEYLAPDRVTSFRLTSGVIYRAVRSSRDPWWLHLLEVDATRCELGFRVVRASDEAGRSLVSEMARGVEGEVVAAVNGDFFTPEDRPLGVDATGGELRGRSPRPVFAWKPGLTPWVGPVEWVEDTLRVGGWAVHEGSPDGESEVIAGFPALLEGGRWVGDLEVSERPAFAAERHPRTAIGWDPEGLRLWIVVVDGRRDGVAEGMSLPELTRLFELLGATEALNLDGGGSSVMVIRGEPVNRPSDPRGERPVVNGLVLLEDEGLCAVPLAATEN